MSDSKILILGASGATGSHLVTQLIENNFSVKVIVRPTSIIPEAWKTNDGITVVLGQVSAYSLEEMREIVADCLAVISCLGHNLTRKGMFGKPRKLVTDAISLVCDAILANNSKNTTKLVLMNTAGNRNRGLNESISVAETVVIGMVRFLLPPHSDNEQAAEYLRLKINPKTTGLEWVIVRPDSLINSEHVSSYSLHPSPVRSALFNPGKTSRINVAHFMLTLISEQSLWNQWKGQMPVIYNDPAV